MKRSDLEGKTLKELKAIASGYGLNSSDVWGDPSKKAVWIAAIIHAQGFEAAIRDTDQAMHRLNQWVAVSKTPLVVRTLILQEILNLSKPAFWFAFYCLRDKGIVDFQEPDVMEISIND